MRILDHLIRTIRSAAAYNAEAQAAPACILWPDPNRQWQSALPPLQVAVARRLGYRWPAESDRSMELSDNARAWVERSTALLPGILQRIGDGQRAAVRSVGERFGKP
jgi:hypothetical protein